MKQSDFQLLFESSPGLYLILSPDFEIVTASDTYLAATLTTRELIVGRNLFEVFPDNPDDFSADGVLNLRASLLHVLNNRVKHTMAVQKYDIRLPDGTFEIRYWSPLNKPVLNTENDVIYIIHRVEDVTDFIRLKEEQEKKERITEHLQEELQRAELEIFQRSQEIKKINVELEKKIIERTDKLISTENQLRLTLDALLEGIQIIDFNWRYIYVNESAAAHGKSSKNEFVGYTMMEKYPGIERSPMFNLMKICMEERIPQIMEAEFVFPDNSVGWFLLSIQPVQEGIFILSLDITERKKSENEKIIAEAERTNLIENLIQHNKDLEQFAFMVSHNIRAPLANIIGFNNVLINESIADDQRIVFRNELSKSVGKLDDVITDLNQVLQVKHEMIETKESIVFMELVKDIQTNLKRLIENKKVEFKLNFNAAKEIISIQSYMQSIFYNLISNSIKYSRPDVKPVIEISSYIENKKLILTFKDNGLGIDLQRSGDQVFGLYKRFHADDVEGKGLGLFMVKTQVERLGGKIKIASEPGNGTTFTIELLNTKN